MTTSDAAAGKGSGEGKLSVAIISYNEEQNIARCLKSVQELASEIVVVDSNSTDRTVEIARSLGAQVFDEAWQGFVHQKNSVLEKCGGDWILSIDCDEEVSPDLAASLKRVLAGELYADGFRINRKTWFLGRWIEHAWYPDWNIRLIRRGAGRFVGQDIHETLEVKGPVASLNGDLHHYSFKDLKDLFERTIRYAATESVAYDRKGKKAKLSKLITNPLHGFFKHYVLKRGFLDGLPGFIVSVMNGVYVFMKYALLWELQRNKSRGR